MAGKLARVRWEMGQALLPEHLVAQEESLLADAMMRFRIGGYPNYGVAVLQWNDSLLTEGVLSIQSMVLVMPSGALLSVGGNAAVMPFNLNTPGSTVVQVYCHLLGDSVVREEHSNGPSQSEGAEDLTLYRVIRQLELSSEPTHREASETLCIAEFSKDPEGAWVLSRDYIPPLIQVGASSFLRAELEELRQLLQPFQEKLAQEIATSYLSGDSMFSAKECLKHSLNIRRLAGNILEQIHPHPYLVYEALKQFYSEVCFYRDATPEYAEDLYNHDHLAECFQRIFEPLQQQIGMAHRKSPYLPFEMKDGLYRLKLPSDLRDAKEAYLIVQKGRTNLRASLEGLKMASLARLPAVHKLALQGIPLKRIDRPPFQHRFGPEVDFYLLFQGDEWDQALRDLSLGFYDLPQFRELRFYLFWRMD